MEEPETETVTTPDPEATNLDSLDGYTIDAGIPSDNVLNYEYYITQNGTTFDGESGEITNEDMVILEEPFVYSENELVVPLEYSIDNIPYCNCQPRVQFLEAKLLALKDFVLQKLGVTLDDDFTIPPEANWSSDTIQEVEVENQIIEPEGDVGEGTANANETENTSFNSNEKGDEKVIVDVDEEKETKEVLVSEAVDNQCKDESSKRKRKKKQLTDYEVDYEVSMSDEEFSSDVEIRNTPILLRKSVQKYSDSVIRTLNKWIWAHIYNPYPNTEDLEQLHNSTGLTKNQLHNWFNNKRRRCPKVAAFIAKQARKQENSKKKDDPASIINNGADATSVKIESTKKQKKKKFEIIPFGDDNLKTSPSSSACSKTDKIASKVVIKKSDGPSSDCNIKKEVVVVENSESELAASSPKKPKLELPNKCSDELEICKISIGCGNCDKIFGSIFELAQHRVTHLRVKLIKLESSIFERFQLAASVKTGKNESDKVLAEDQSYVDRVDPETKTVQCNLPTLANARDVGSIDVSVCTEVFPDSSPNDSYKPACDVDPVVNSDVVNVLNVPIANETQFKEVLGNRELRLLLHKLTQQEIGSYLSKKPKVKKYKKKKFLFDTRKKSKLNTEKRRSPRIVELNELPIKNLNVQLTSASVTSQKQKKKPSKAEKKCGISIAADQGGKSPKKLFKSHPPKCSASIILSESHKAKEKKTKRSHKTKKQKAENNIVKQLFQPPRSSEAHHQWPYSYAKKSTPAPPSHEDYDDYSDEDEAYEHNQKGFCDTEIIDSDPIGINELNKLQAQGRVVDIRSELFIRCSQCDRIFENQMDLVMHSLDHNNTSDVAVTLSSTPPLVGTLLNVTSTLPILDTVADTPIEVQDPTGDLLINDDPLFNELSLPYTQPQIVEPVNEVHHSSEEDPQALMLQDISSAGFQSSNYELNGFETNGIIPNCSYDTTIPSPYKMNSQIRASEYMTGIYCPAKINPNNGLFPEFSTIKTVEKSKNGIRKVFT